MSTATSATPAFNPRFFTEGGVEFYDDDRMFAAIDRSVNAGKQHIVISEWSSHFRDQGCSVKALQWFREQGFAVIAANGVGLIEEGVGDVATAYWEHMHSRGLVDVLVDDNGIDITPGGAPPRA